MAFSSEKMIRNGVMLSEITFKESVNRTAILIAAFFIR